MFSRLKVKVMELCLTASSPPTVPASLPQTRMVIWWSMGSAPVKNTKRLVSSFFVQKSTVRDGKEKEQRKKWKKKWATSRENVSSGIFDQVRFKPACSATQAS